ncbi:MAG: hypothetical protein J6E46_13400 [Faecalicoccus sp.]|nr:hypothetical protein [Faecalicoccus sp.]
MCEDKDINVTRIHLKTDCEKHGGTREDLIDFCLGNDKPQYVAIGWSNVHDQDVIKDYESYYNAIQTPRKNPVLNVFKGTHKGDLFWTRDLDGFYWICRAEGEARTEYDSDLDIGAVIPVKAYKVGLEVPGQIKASFNRPLGGTSERIHDKLMKEYSKYVFNEASGNPAYEIKKVKEDVIDNLPEFDLEELVIIYLQVKEGYYVLSNSIAKKSTTIKIECELMSRNKNNPRKAVVQVKAGQNEYDAGDYQKFVEEGYLVYLYGNFKNCNESGYIHIEKDDLKSFYDDYKTILPKSITKWENLFDKEAK